MAFAGAGDDGGGTAELDCELGVGGDEELEDCGVVAGAEGAADEACAVGQWVADTAKVEGFGCGAGGAAEGVLVLLEFAGFGVEAWFGLLVEDFEDGFEGEVVPVVEEGFGARALVELVAQGKKVCEGIDFPFAFEDAAGFGGGVNAVILTVADRGRWEGGGGWKALQ